MQIRRCFLLSAVALLFFVFPLAADKRTENIDIVLALDKSLSMADNGKIDSVESYVKTWLLGDVVIPGDYLVVVAFYGKADVVVSQSVSGPDDVAKIKEIVSSIRANGHYTDIGNALDTVKDQMTLLANDGRKKFVLLMTDGHQEAPPTSKYYSPDGTFNHEFLSNTKTIQELGWKIEVLGIGTETQVKELAEELSGSYASVPATPTQQSLVEQTQNLLGSSTPKEEVPTIIVQRYWWLGAIAVVVIAALIALAVVLARRRATPQRKPVPLQSAEAKLTSRPRSSQKQGGPTGKGKRS